MANTTLQEAVSRFGADAKAKLAGYSISGQPEDQLRAPLEQLIRSLGAIAAFAAEDINPIGETLISGMQTRPDYAVEYRKALIGFIEVKAPGKGCDPRNFSDAHDKTQWGKLKSLPNLIYTDGNGFTLWRDGKLIGKPVLLEGGIENAGAKLTAPDGLIPLFADFLGWTPITPKNAKALAEVSARLCRFLRDEVLEEMEQGNSALKNLKHDWQKLLFPEADDAQFADGYAQAVTFGLLVARAYDIPLKEGIDLAALRLKKSNTLIGTALGILTGDAGSQKTLKTSISALLRVLHEVNWHEVSKDKPEAWLYFYEDFLGVYDNALKKKTGSYYTPPEVVEAMVRLVDEALRGPLFERPEGLASSDVTIADPAVGTGTFLLGVLRHIAETTRQSYGDELVPGAVAAASKRMFGFELQFGPFAVAQLRLLAEMRSLMNVSLTKDEDAPTPEVNLYITDTLGNPFAEEEQLPQVVEAVAKSRREANKVKRGQPITVVIGNPPYKHHAAGKGSWIENGSDGRPSPMSRWTPPLDWGLGTHTHHLKNLYVYFWRWATLKVFGSGWQDATAERDTDRHGVACFISAAGFLNGPGFEKMREDLRRDCSEIWVVDCSPDGHQPDVPTRIFQGVQQPVCIVLAARSPEKDRSKPAKVHCVSLPEGKRELKFNALNSLSLRSSDWQDGPSGWREAFLPERAAYWSSCLPLPNCFNWAGSGVTPHRIWPIAADNTTLENRWEMLRKEKDPYTKERLFQPDSDRNVNSVVNRSLDRQPVRQSAVTNDSGKAVPAVRYGYRSFDRQWILPDSRLLSRARPELWKLHSLKQAFMTGVERVTPKNGPAITLTSLIPDLDHYHGRGGRVYPLYADAKAEHSNISQALLDVLAEAYGAMPSAEDVFAYIAAVLAHPAFTARFRTDLKQPGLRVPFTADAALYAEGTALGRELIWLHTYGERFHDASAGRPKGAPRLPQGQWPQFVPGKPIAPAPEPLPDVMDYDPVAQRLKIGKGEIGNVTPAMRDYEVSGKNVLTQWFSYRRRDRTKPVIGDRRPPSPLEKIQPDGWLHEYTADLLDLLHVLGRLIELEPKQTDLLSRICDGALVPKQAFVDAGLAENSSSVDDETE
jgi:hypothetical protein